ncbi:hypothetical protein [Bremerella sp. P1]|uniref:hypothetical protein n=1 Tax=Bremerella sp. P1 TaxID=3026424 RepID=UPI0023681A08|nr:hypothetical protein [Bremerella sp. P1]WDI44758.1 hypothetical protein PSR63_12510 [Bremerella sp. P1]
MLNESHVIQVRLTDQMLDMCQHFALELCHWDSPSLIFDNKMERANRKWQDSYTGILGEAAVAFWLGRYSEWIECRSLAAVSKNPQLPYDIPGTIIDAKARAISKEQPDPLGYKMYVREVSTHKQATFVQVVVDASEHHALCHIVGWMGTDEIITTQHLDATTKYSIKACDLHPIPKIHGVIPGGDR